MKAKSIPHDPESTHCRCVACRKFRALNSLPPSGFVWSIGQLSAEVRRTLDNMASAGELLKERALWPWYHRGTIRKTIYRKPGPIPADLLTR